MTSYTFCNGIRREAAAPKVRYIEGKVYHSMLPVFVDKTFRLVYFVWRFYQFLIAAYTFRYITYMVVFLSDKRDPSRFYCDSNPLSDKSGASLNLVASDLLYSFEVKVHKRCKQSTA